MAAWPYVHLVKVLTVYVCTLCGPHVLKPSRCSAPCSFSQLMFKMHSVSMYWAAGHENPSIDRLLVADDQSVLHVFFAHWTLLWEELETKWNILSLGQCIMIRSHWNGDERCNISWDGLESMPGHFYNMYMK